jgi:hypothetical protein
MPCWKPSIESTMMRLGVATWHHQHNTHACLVDASHGSGLPLQHCLCPRQQLLYAIQYITIQHMFGIRPAPALASEPIGLLHTWLALIRRHKSRHIFHWGTTHAALVGGRYNCTGRPALLLDTAAPHPVCSRKPCRACQVKCNR